MADADDHALEDYKIHVQALTDQYGRMWTRFNFFLTLHTALAVALIGLFRDELLETEVLAIPAIGILMSALWYVNGAQDRYLVNFYRAMITYAADRLPGESRPHSGLPIEKAVALLAPPQAGKYDARAAEEAIGIHRGFTQWRCKAISVTTLPVWVPTVIGALWLGTAIGLAVPSVK